MNEENLVRIRGLTKVFGERETRVDAVRDVDLELARGEIVLVMGPSGSGKTTLLSMLGGLLRPSAGEIWVDGVDIAALPERELPPFRAKTFGFIFQDFNLLAALSSEENVEVALNPGRPPRRRRHERATELLTLTRPRRTASASPSTSSRAARSSASPSPAPSPTSRR